MPSSASRNRVRRGGGRVELGASAGHGSGLGLVLLLWRDGRPLAVERAGCLASSSPRPMPNCYLLFVGTLHPLCTETVKDKRKAWCCRSRESTMAGRRHFRSSINRPHPRHASLEQAARDVRRLHPSLEWVSLTQAEPPRPALPAASRRRHSPSGECPCLSVFRFHYVTNARVVLLGPLVYLLGVALLGLHDGVERPVQGSRHCLMAVFRPRSAVRFHPFFFFFFLSIGRPAHTALYEKTTKHHPLHFLPNMTQTESLLKTRNEYMHGPHTRIKINRAPKRHQHRPQQQQNCTPAASDTDPL